MKKKLSRRYFVKGAVLASASVVAAANVLHSTEVISSSAKPQASGLVMSGRESQKGGVKIRFLEN